jgi:hypothetical protein
LWWEKEGRRERYEEGEGKTRNENKKEVIFPERRNLHAR